MHPLKLEAAESRNRFAYGKMLAFRLDYLQWPSSTHPDYSVGELLFLIHKKKPIFYKTIGMSSGGGICERGGQRLASH